MTSKPRASYEGWVGLSAMALLGIGVAALACAFIGVFTDQNMMGPGVCFLAGAVAFGALFIALTR